MCKTNHIKKPRLYALLSLSAVVFLSGCGAKNQIVIRSADDAKHAKIGVMTGSTGEALAKARFPQAQVNSFDDIMDSITALKSGHLDAVVTNYATAFLLSKKNPELGALPEHLDNEDTSVAIRKGNDELLATVNRIISELAADGTLESMKKRWFKTDLGPYEEPDIPLPREGTALRIGVCATREPFSFVDKDGRVTGHDGELARIIAARLHRPVEFSNMKFMALIPALQSGKVDMIVTGMTATKERSRLVDFSRPYFANAQVMLVRKPPAAAGRLRLVTPEDLKDKRIAVLLGSAHDTYAKKNYPNATILQYSSPSDIALAVRSGKADAALYDAEPLREILRENDSMAVLGGPLFTFSVATAFNRNAGGLKQDFDRFLAEIKRNGVYADMLNRWMEKRELRMPKIDRAKTSGTLVVGVSDTGAPFTIVKDNQLVGFDVELSERFAAFLGKEVKFANMEFGSLIAAVSTGKIDMIASSLYVTEERKKQVIFGEPYFEMATRVFALKSNMAAYGGGPAAGAAGPASAPPASTQGKLSSPDDLKNRRIGVLLGSVHDVWVTQKFPQATILEYKSPPDLLLAVRSGKADAAMYTRETLLQMLRDDQELGLLGGNVQSYQIGIGFRKGNDPLREQFNAFLAGIKKNGVYDDMVKRWITAGDTRMPKIDNPGAHGKIIAGYVSDKGLPFTIIRDNQPVGFDIELAERFGASLGRKIEFSDMEFGSLIAAASTGKIDMIVSTLMITPERKAKIDFSDAYYELGANFFALRSNIAAYQSAEDIQKTPSFFRKIINSFNSNFVLEKRYLLIGDGLKTTVVISIGSTLFGTLLGALVCFMRMSKRRLLNVPAKLYIAALRGTPVLVLLMLTFYVVFASVDINPVLVAVIAFGMNFAAYVSEMFRTGIEGVDKGQREAGIAMGFSRFQTFLYIVLPQTVRRILPVYKGEFISLVKMTSIVGYIAVQDLTKASDIIRARTFDAFFPLIMVAVLYFAISWFLMQSLEYWERTTDPKCKLRKVGAA